jgi:hypothetical protein
MSSHKDDHPIGDLYTAMTGAGHGHDEQPIGPPRDAVLGVGHEPDTFNVKPILTVPVFIGIVMVGAFAITSGFFAYFGAFSKPKDTPINDRFARISSSDEKAEVKQPRLEHLRKSDSKRIALDGKPMDDEAFFRSVRFDADGNSPFYRPEDLRAENYVDPITKQKVLRDYAYATADKSVARIPIDVAMKLILAKKSLAVQSNVSVPVTGTGTLPKLSNGGNELPANAAKMPDAKAKPAADKKDH